MNSAKPFVCPAIGCNQQFANEDHLEVHRRKHEMSLGLRDFKSSLDTPIIADQTPTPTRFLKNCEEVGLFSDLPNPFDAEFRKASEFHSTDSPAIDHENNEDSETEKTAENDDIESTNISSIATVGDTTSTTITASPQDVSSTTQEEEAASVVTLAPQVLTTTSAPSYPSIPVAITKSPLKLVQGIQQKPRTITIQQQGVVAVTSGQSVVTQVAVPQVAVPQVAVQAPISVTAVAPAMAASGDAKVSIANVNMPLLNTIPISAPILLRLPTGQTIPMVPPGVANPAIQIPLAVSAVAESQATQSQTSNAAPVVVSEGNVKMKLKNALLTSQSQGNMGVMTQAVEVVTRQQQAVTSTSIALPPKSEFTVMQVSPGRRKSQEGDSDEKRRRFLERNRAAATRCRNKRKQWINNLEEKADDLNVTNNKLQNEVTSLRNEVAQLKQLLLAHKDCPVTILQRKAQVQILPGSGAADLQAVNAGESEAMEVSGAQQMATVIQITEHQEMS